jgi:phage shock protein A
MTDINPDALMEEIAKIERFWKELDPGDFELVEADGSTKDDPDVAALRESERQSRATVRTAMLKHVGLQKKALRTLFQGKIKPRILTVLDDAKALVAKAAESVDRADGEFKKTLAELQKNGAAHADLEKTIDEFERDWQTIHEFAEALRDRKKKSEDLPPVTRKLLTGGVSE